MDGVNPYLETVRRWQRADESDIRQSLLTAVDKNPDVEARLQGLARQYQLPVEAVRLDQDTVARRSQLDAVPYRQIVQSLPATAALLRNPQQAAVAHDDVDNLTATETLLNSFKRGVIGLKTLVPSLRAVDAAAALQQFDEVDSAEAGKPFDNKQFNQTPLDQNQLGVLGESYARLTNADERAQFRALYAPRAQADLAANAQAVSALAFQREQLPLPASIGRLLGAAGFAEAGQAIADDPLRILAGIGPESLVQQAPFLAAAVPAGVLGGPLAAAGVIGGGSALTDYAANLLGNLQQAGVNVQDAEAVREAWRQPDILAKVLSQSAKHAGVVGLFDAVSGGIAGRSLLPQTLAGKLAGRPLAETLANLATQLPVQAGLGAAGEAGGEWAAEQAIQPGQVLAEAFGELFGAPAEVLSASAGHLLAKQQAVQTTEADNRIAELAKLAQASKVLQRDPALFKAFVEQISPEHLYIDAQAFLHSGVAEQVAALLPEVAKQLKTAVVSGGEISLPLADFVSKIAATPLAGPLLEHLRLAGEAFSRAGAAEYLAKHDDQLKADIAQTLAQKKRATAWANSVESVRQAVQDGLDQLGFHSSQVNSRYAALHSAYFATMAERLGVMPDALFKSSQLNFARFGAEQNGLGQILADAMPDGMELGDGAKAAAMYRGDDKTKAILLGQAEGKLIDAAPSLSRYSHSISQDALTHIRNRHSDKKTEKSRGQLPVREKDIAAIPDIIASYDAIRLDLMSDLGRPVIAYSKATPDGVLLYMEEVRKKRVDLAALSMRRYPATADVLQVLKSAADGPNVLNDGGHGSILDDNSDKLNDHYLPSNRGEYYPTSRTIALLDKADLSTFLHESGHFFLDFQLETAQKLEALAAEGEPLTALQQQVVDDVRALLKSYGVESIADWHSLDFEQQRLHHEQFAEGFEKYLFTGKAPSLSLARVFAAFRAWLTAVYRKIKAGDFGKIELSPEVSQIMDRMLASDEEIRRAAGEAGGEPAVKEKETEWQASINQVHEAVKAGLNAVGRHAETVNDQYAHLMSAYFATMAERLGVMPDALFKSSQLNFARFGAEQNGLGQILADAMPDGMELGDGAKAAAMYRGDDKTKAILLGQAEGKLIDAAPSLSRYSHSISQDALTHIRNRHSDKKTEKSRGQLPVREKDIAAIPDIIASYDAIRLDLMSDLGRPVIAYSKATPDGVLLYMEEVRKKRVDLAALSMRRYPATADVLQVLKSAADGPNVLNDGGHGSILDDNSDKLNDHYLPSNRGEYYPTSRTIALLDKADLSTFLHESGHFFLDFQLETAQKLEALAAEGEPLTALQQQVVDDVRVLKAIHQQAVMPRAAYTFDEARAAAKAFQGKPLRCEGIVATVSRNNIDKMLSKKAVAKSSSPSDQALAVANLDKLFAEALYGWSKPDDKGSISLKAVHRLFAPMLTDAGMRMVKMTVKESAHTDQGAKLYTVESVEVDKEGSATQLVESFAKSDGLDQSSIGNAEPLNTLAQQIQDYNKVLHQSNGLAHPHPLSYSGRNQAVEALLSLYDKSDNGKGYEQDNRGEYSPDTRTIALLESADLSTFLHESAHFFLDMQLQLADELLQQPPAKPQPSAFYQSAQPKRAFYGFSDEYIDSLNNNDLPPGEYGVKTRLVTEQSRVLGVNKVITPEDAAQALSYLDNSPMERSEVLVTDKRGKPLAIIGAFKGSLKQVATPLHTLVTEAFSVKGAANLWMAHNHPGSLGQFSTEDENSMRHTANFFWGSKIKVRGFLVFGRDMDGVKNWSYAPGPAYLDGWHNGVTQELTPGNKPKRVPVLERVYSEDGAIGPRIVLPLTNYDISAISKGRSGVMMVNSRLTPVAFIPIDAAAIAKLRKGGRMDDLYRALSQSNASNVVIVNHGELSEEGINNLSGFFNHLNITMRDVVEMDGSRVISHKARGIKYDELKTFKQGPVAAQANHSATPADEQPAETADSDHIDDRVNPQHTAGQRQILADTQALLDWFGVATLAEWHRLDFEQQRRYHEQFAQAFERYLFEGKAPSLALQNLFEQFKAWLLRIYHSLTGWDNRLNDEVRGVFDRMLASETDIKQAQQAAGMRPMFADAKAAGFSEATFADYQALDKQAEQAAATRLQGAALRDMQWQQAGQSPVLQPLQQRHQALREAMMAAASQAVKSRPLYRAWDFLHSGAATDKLNAAAAGLDLSPHISKQLRQLGVLSRQGGLPPDLVAELFGFSSGDELLKALATAEPPEVVIRRLSDQWMLQQHGELSTPAARWRLADQAVHNALQAQRVAMEADALALQSGEKRLPGAALEAYAADMLRDLPLSALKPEQYRRAEGKAAAVAQQAWQAGELKQAALAKRRQLLNLYAVSTAYRIEDEVANDLQYLKNLQPAELSPGPRAQIAALLVRFALPVTWPVTWPVQPGQPGLAAWLARQRLRGVLPVIAPKILDPGYQQSYRAMNVQAFREVIAAIRQLEHLGRQARQWSAAKPQLIADLDGQAEPLVVAQLGRLA